MLKFHRLPARPPEWDRLIQPYPTKTLFHESAWLDHVLTIHPRGRVDYFEITDGGQVVGHHCGLHIRKMGLPIHGSPLGGTGTNYMGPLVHAHVEPRAVVQGLRTLFGPRQCLHLELCHPNLDPQLMAEAGFQLYESTTHVLALPTTEEEAWKLLKGTARNRIRKAGKNGLTVERVEDSAIVQHYDAQYREVYAKQNLSPPYGEARPRSLFAHLLPAKRLLPLEVRHGDEVVATGFFPYDERCIYFWGAASWLQHQRLCPNELLHWGVIQFAVDAGIPTYNMCGTSKFKDKFGGADVPHITYSKSALPLLQYARNWYRQRHFRSLEAKPA